MLTILVSFCRISNGLSDEINLFWHCSSPLRSINKLSKLKATFQLTISLLGQRATGKIQRNSYHHGSCGPTLTGKTSSVFLMVLGQKPQTKPPRHKPPGQKPPCQKTPGQNPPDKTFFSEIL